MVLEAAHLTAAAGAAAAKAEARWDGRKKGGWNRDSLQCKYKVGYLPQNLCLIN
jgi:hypothetical protein